MPPRKHLSVHEKGKKRKRIEQLIQSQAGNLDKYVYKVTQFTSLVKDLMNEHVDHKVQNGTETEEVKDADENVIEYANVNAIENVNEEANATQSEEADAFENMDASDEIKNERVEPWDIYDPANWNKIDQELRDVLVQRGPITKDATYDFPVNESGRHFPVAQYVGNLSNGKKYIRKWLVYSCVADKVFCFCCKLFMQDRAKIQLAMEGCKDWKNISQKLKEHERSRDHVTCMAKWTELEMRLKKNETVDKTVKEMMVNKEGEHGMQGSSGRSYHLRSFDANISNAEGEH